MSIYKAKLGELIRVCYYSLIISLMNGIYAVVFGDHLDGLGD